MQASQHRVVGAGTMGNGIAQKGIKLREPRMPHRVCPKCGRYKGPEVMQVGKFVVNAMGSDHTPHTRIDGALAATRDLEIGVISRRADRCGRAGVAP